MQTLHRHAAKILAFIFTLVVLHGAKNARANEVQIPAYEAAKLTENYLQGILKGNTSFVGPKFIYATRGQRVNSGCTGGDIVNGSFYCPASRIIVLEFEQIYELYRRLGDGAVAYVVAHEFAHHMQNVIGVRLKNPFHEQHADCYTGALLLHGEGHAIKRMGISKSDVYEFVGTAHAVGGGRIHGSSEERVQAFVRGANHGLRGCDEMMAGRKYDGSSSGSSRPTYLPPTKKSPAPITPGNGYTYLGTASNWSGTTTTVQVSGIQRNSNIISGMVKKRKNGIDTSLMTYKFWLNCEAQTFQTAGSSPYSINDPDMGAGKLIFHKYC